MNVSRNTLVAVLVTLLLGAWFSWIFRYDMHMASTPDGYPMAYRLDRWTGEMRLIEDDQWYPVVQGDPEDLRYSSGQPSQSVY